MNIAEIVFVNIADNPHVREIGDRKQVGGVVKTLDAFEPGNILLDDGSGDRSPEFDHGAGVRGISAENAQAAFGGLLIRLGLGVGVLGNFQIFLGKRSLGVEQLGAFEGLGG